MTRKKRSGPSTGHKENEPNGTRLVNADKIKAFMRSKALSLENAAEALDVSVHTLERMLNGQPVRPCSVAAAAARMAIPVSELLINGQEGAEGLLMHSEWEVTDQVADWSELAAGLHYRIHRLKHRFLPETYARRKCYRLRNLATRDEKRYREYFLRHPRIVRRLRTSPYFPANHAVFGESGNLTWWIIDEWIAGHTLQAALKIGPLSARDLPTVMLHVAEALLVLHRAVIICRCLCPANIVVRETNGSIVLTDLELSKLTDGSPTVKNHIHVHGPYQAPEVVERDGELDASTDIFSWGRILLHAAGGFPPDRGTEQAIIEKLPVPSDIRTLVKRSVALNRRERPQSMDEVISVMRRSF